MLTNKGQKTQRRNRLEISGRLRNINLPSFALALALPLEEIAGSRFGGLARSYRFARAADLGFERRDALFQLARRHCGQIFTQHDIMLRFARKQFFGVDGHERVREVCVC